VYGARLVCRQGDHPLHRLLRRLERRLVRPAEVRLFPVVVVDKEGLVLSFRQVLQVAGDAAQQVDGRRVVAWRKGVEGCKGCKGVKGCKGRCRSAG